VRRVARLPAEVATFLRQNLGKAAVGAFIYGSVAEGRARRGSDIDCFVLTKSDLHSQIRADVGRTFAAFQRRLGYSPDLAFPIEIFGTRRCIRAIERNLSNANSSCLSDSYSQCRERARIDDLEIVRALQGVKILVLPSRSLDRITQLATGIRQMEMQAGSRSQ
jgi:predicted nucleotidyltransferase